MTKDTPDTPRTEPRWPDAFNRVIAERNAARAETAELRNQIRKSILTFQCYGLESIQTATVIAELRMLAEG